MKIAKLTSLFALIFITSMSFPKAYGQNHENVTIGTAHSLYSEVLSEERLYWVSLPSSYDAPNNTYKRYPLMIVLDGDVHFRPASQVVHFMGGVAHVPEMIVVGIKNVNRERDYTPDKIITVRKNDTGGGDNFLGFLEKELIPEMDKNYRTGAFRILAGHSLGGLLAVHAYMKKNTLFNGFIAVDPSFGAWDAPTMDKKVAAVAPASFDRFLYLASANSGSGKARNEDRHQRLFEALKEKSTDHFYAMHGYFENEDHRSLPLIAWYKGLRSVFDGYKVAYNSSVSVEELSQIYEAISKRLSFSFLPPERLVNRMGYRILNSRSETERVNALDFFLLNTRNYPSSYNAFDSLAEAYARLGNKDEAIKNYRKSLGLNPGNSNAERQIQKLLEGKD